MKIEGLNQNFEANYCLLKSFKNDSEIMNFAAKILDFILIRNYCRSSNFSEIITACCLFLIISVEKTERSFSKSKKLIIIYVKKDRGIILITNEEAKKVDIQHLLQMQKNYSYY